MIKCVSLCPTSIIILMRDKLFIPQHWSEHDRPIQVCTETIAGRQGASRIPPLQALHVMI